MRVRRCVLAAVTTVAFLATIPAAHASTSLESRLAYLQNRDRTAFGRPALQPSQFLSSLARAHARNMAAARRIWHDPSLPSLVGVWEYVGDNVGRSTSLEQLHAGFMASREHRENLMFWGYEHYGVGVATGRDGYVYAVVVFFTPYRGHSKQQRPEAAAPKSQGEPQTIEMLVRLVSLDGHAA